MQPNGKLFSIMLCIRSWEQGEKKVLGNVHKSRSCLQDEGWEKVKLKLTGILLWNSSKWEWFIDVYDMTFWTNIPQKTSQNRLSFGVGCGWRIVIMFSSLKLNVRWCWTIFHIRQHLRNLLSKKYLIYYLPTGMFPSSFRQRICGVGSPSTEQ